MNKSLLSIAITLTMVAGDALAAPAHRGGERHSFTADKTRTTDHGTYSSHTVQTKTENGFTRDSVRTNPDGKTATRDMSVSNDPTTKTHTRDVSGTTFGGKTYSSESVTQRTDDGYTRDSTHTGPNGKTSSRDVDASVDKENHTLTKNMTATGPDGQVHTQTVTKQYSKNDVGGSAE